MYSPAAINPTQIHSLPPSNLLQPILSYPLHHLQTATLTTTHTLTAHYFPAPSSSFFPNLTHLTSVHDEGSVLRHGLVRGLSADEHEIRRGVEGLDENARALLRDTGECTNQPGSLGRVRVRVPTKLVYKKHGVFFKLSGSNIELQRRRRRSCVCFLCVCSFVCSCACVCVCPQSCAVPVFFCVQSTFFTGLP